MFPEVASLLSIPRFNSVFFSSSLISERSVSAAAAKLLASLRKVNLQTAQLDASYLYPPSLTPPLHPRGSLFRRRRIKQAREDQPVCVDVLRRADRQAHIIVNDEFCSLQLAAAARRPATLTEMKKRQIPGFTSPRRSVMKLSVAAYRRRRRRNDVVTKESGDFGTPLFRLCF